VRGQRHALATLFYPERPGTYYTGGWVAPRTGPDSAENLAPIGIRSANRLARSQSLYRQSYPAHKALSVEKAYFAYGQQEIVWYFETKEGLVTV